MMRAILKAVALLGLALGLNACAHHPSRVKCDGPLQPINVPAATQVGNAFSSDAGPRQK
jgi:hypothetical protein